MAADKWVEDGGERYRVGPSGERLTGEQYISGKWYWLDPDRDGAMATGFTDLPSGKTVLYGEDGAMLYGEQYVSGKWYFFNTTNGTMATGLTKLPSGKTVLYGEDGAMLYGFQELPGGGEAYFDPVNGSMAADKWVEDGDSRYYFDSNGRFLAEIRTDKTGMTLFSESGVQLYGWQDCDGIRYYADPESGYLVTGEAMIDGAWRYFDSSGAMQTGFVLLDKPSAQASQKWVYYDLDGAMLYGEQLINGSWYYLDPVNGAVTYGWKYLDREDKWVYYGPVMGNGKMRYGVQMIDGVRRYFDPVSGACDKIGYQNPPQYYQVSTRNVSLPSYASGGIFSYVSPSVISVDGTREDMINTMIARAYDYVGTPYKWDYACAPGVGVDCAGLVMQSLYACGMDLSPMNPWDHYYQGLSGGWHSAYANYMWENGKFLHLSYSERQRGDILSWPGHVAIYMGNDMMIEAPAPGSSVRICSSNIYGTPRGVLRPFC